MITRTRTLEQIRLIGLEALSRELGPVYDFGFSSSSKQVMVIILANDISGSIN